MGYIPLICLMHKIIKGCSRFVYLRMARIMRINSCSVFLPCLLFSCFFIIGISHAALDSLGVGDVMRDGQSLYSSSGGFRLIFFDHTLHSTRYLGIQDTVTDRDNVLWVANRDTPLNDTSGVLTLTQNGNLVITNYWGISITINSATSSNTSATATTTLLDSGNLVLRDGEMHIIWQSFDYPTNTFLQGMKLGIALDSNTGRLRNRNLTSWLTPQVAVDGPFTLGVDPNNTKQLVIWERGVVYWRSGIWNGYNFSNLSHLDKYGTFNNLYFSYISNEKENYFTFTTFINGSLPSWIQLKSMGLITLSVNQELVYVTPCDYGSTEDWIYTGCVTPKPPNCRGRHVFYKMLGYYKYEWDYYLKNYSLGISDCKELCLRNCSCNAFASQDVTGCKFSANQKPDGEFTRGGFYVRKNIVGQNACLSYTFPKNAVYSSCNYLPVLNSFLHWNYNQSAGTVSIAYRQTGITSTTRWICWAINPSGLRMVGSQALVAYRNSNGTMRAHTSPVTAYQTSLSEGGLSFNVSGLSATYANNEMTIFATLELTGGVTTVNQVWQEGPMRSGSPSIHPTIGDNMKSMGTVNFLSGQTTYEVLNKARNDHPKKRRLWLIVGAPVVFLTILTLVSVLSYLRWKWCCFEGKVESNQDGFIQETENASTSVTAIDDLEGAHKLELRGEKGHELLLFNFSSIEIATDHFSDANKLGQGGFGPVYKGKLIQGQEIAVKRLSRNSRQGLDEFKNEILLISKLQHRNLVRLLGCCIQGEERILIYEYLPNKSLDSFLFDATKRVVLDWKKRKCIIDGIAQGLLYLHKYSRLRIIHRDLKTSNILLDNEMNPKISDFGTARIFRENESQASTNRIIGTYGYMSPEYAMDGSFSVKSDVFSFGVVMLEIISGKKNSGFFQPNRPLNLLGHVCMGFV